MYRRNGCVGSGGEDGEGLQYFRRSGRLPTVPKRGEGERVRSGGGDGVRLFGFRVELLPLIKTIGGNQTALAFEGRAKCGRSGDGFRTSIKSGEANLRVFRP